MNFDDLDCQAFPYNRPLGEYRDREWFAYIIPLLFGRARINVTHLDDAYGVKEFW